VIERLHEGCGYVAATAVLDGGEHALQGHFGPLSDFWMHLDLVRDTSGHQLLQYPGQVGRVNPIHGGAGADDRVEAEDELVRILFGETVDQIDLGAHGPLAACGSLTDGLDNEL